MSAKHALLGLLQHKPDYPYRLADLLEKRLGPSWRVNTGQVYQAVKKLEDEGLIERVGAGHDGREVRAITPAGVREFERWFTKGPIKGGQLIRRPVVLKVTLSGPERLEDVVLQLDLYEEACTDRLEEIRGLKEAEDPASGLRVWGDAVLLRLSMSADIFQLEGELRWAKLAREGIRSLMEEDVIWLSRQDRANDRAQLEREDARERLFDRMSARDLGGPAR